MIYTVTFNPSLDYLVTVDDFKLGLTNRTSSERLVPGGKGLNVSMVLGRLELGEYSPYGMSDSYAIYTMDANGYPINIDTYASDGTLTGQCTLEWAVIERT